MSNAEITMAMARSGSRSIRCRRGVGRASAVVAVAAIPAAWVAAEADASSSVTKGSFMSDDYLLIRTPHGKIAKPAPLLRSARQVVRALRAVRDAARRTGRLAGRGGRAYRGGWGSAGNRCPARN